MLVERDRELRSLRDALGACRDGRGGTVLVSGEAGIGKTSLLTAFAEQVAADASVLFGACDDLHTARALGPFRDMFDPLPDGPPGAPDRERYIALLRAHLGARERPGVVMVDDAHWADAASLDIIRYLGRRLGTLPGLLVVSYRPDELTGDHPLRRLLGALTTPATRRLDLRPLSDEVVGRLATRAGRDPQALIAAVGGNPFYLTEALAATGPEIPPTVRDAVLARVAGLPEHSRRALELLSVVPTGADRDLLERLLGTPALEALVPAERAGIVRWTDDRVGFRHELARGAVESSLPAVLRAGLNGAVMDRLIESGAPASRVVHHAVAAGDRAALSRFACVAADEAAAAQAHRQTAAYSRLGLDQTALLEPHTVARLHGLAARALYALGQFGAAAEHAEQTVRSWERLGDAPLDLGPVLLASSRMHMMNGRADDARADIVRALALLRPLGPGRALAYAYATMGDLEAIEANCADAAGWCRRALAMAEELTLPDVEAYARIYLGMARVGLRERDGAGELAGLADLGTAVELARQLDNGEFLCRASANLAMEMIWLGRHREAAPHLAVADAAARDYGLDYIRFHVLAGYSHVDVYCGRWAEAERRLRGQLGTDRDPAAMMVLPMSLLGRVLLRRGDPEGEPLVLGAWELALRSRQGPRVAQAGCAMIERAWLAGDGDTARAVGDVVQPLAQRANYAYFLGDARRYLRRVGVDVPGFEGCPAGFAAGIAGDAATAAAAWRAAGNPYEQALEEVAGDDPATVLAGIRRLDSLGATATANRVRRDLSRRGLGGVPRGPRSSTRTHPGGLTARQQDVLALLAEGLTTARIAQRLYLSPRTVDNHVAQILARLGVTSRRDAVDIAWRAGWLPPGNLSSAAAQSE